MTDPIPAAGRTDIGPPAPSAPETPPTAPDPRQVGSPLSDGEWHRLHPLTPLFRGGLFLVVVIGIVIANFRDRLIELFFPLPAGRNGRAAPPDPIDYVLSHDLAVVAVLVVVGVAALLVGAFYVSWRFHTFRITGDDVEVRSGVLFRSHRQSPLDRVQGVNLTRPMVARLLGMAKLEVVGAGLDANVKLEYLSTSSAEAVRADILQLASGRQLAERALRGEPRTRREAASSAVSEGITGLIVGAEQPVEDPSSVVHIPIGRIVASHLLSGSTIGLVILIAAIVVGAVLGTPWILFAVLPTVLGFGAYWVRGITKTLRYSIAPRSTGVRITFGLFTTVTEVLPPGRIHAVEIRQSVLWRPFGWWSITVNRLSGGSAAQSAADPFTTVLPVGAREDVAKVLQLLLPAMPEAEWPVVFDDGVLGPRADDPYTNTPRRARLLRLLSWRRNGFLLVPGVLLLRRGFIWRTLGIFPLARAQSFGLEQGPLARALGLAAVTVHTIAGRVTGNLGVVDRDAALALFADVSAATVAAAATDRSHRWAGGEDLS
ncbi:PH domain-containing protein [Microbacterium sp. 1P10UB]|uniref:PH domain-containing protein n=1 Tax=unclassified Microbacterium TaxID=2609290 RepID=UPI0039A05266